MKALQYLESEINTAPLTPIQFTGILRSMEKYKEEQLKHAFKAGFYSYEEVDRNYDPSEQLEGFNEAWNEYKQECNL